jgi:hypothetical protein
VYIDLLFLKTSIDMEQSQGILLIIVFFNLFPSFAALVVVLLHLHLVWGLKALHWIPLIQLA